MNGYLRQSTAAQTRTIGPFIDSTDFVTPDDGLTIANTDIRVKKNGAADVAKNSGGGTADVNGMYAVTWDATDTDTVGELQFSVVVAGALIVWGIYVVLEEAVYDALFAAAAPGYLQPTTAGRQLDVTATGAAGIDWGNVENQSTAVNLSATNIDPDQVVASVTGAVGSVTGAVGSVTGNVNGNVVGSVGSVIADVGITQGAADKVWLSAARTLTSFGTLVADVATAVWAAVSRTLTSLAGNAADIRNAVGLASANLDTQLGGIQTDTTALLADTSTIIANQATINGNVLTRATPAQVNAEVVDALNVDTYGEPTGVPPATTTLVQKIGRLHMALRNGVIVDANTGKKQFLDDGGAAEWEKDFTDAGSIYTESEANAP